MQLRRKPGKAGQGRLPKKLSRTRQPADMSLEEWQITLRREFGLQQKFQIRNLGEAPIFSEFQVINPKTKGRYRVAIRSQKPGDNFCSCPDFAVNTLGTCKHIEYVLGRLERKPGARQLLQQGCQPAFSEVYLRYGAKQEIVFHPGTECPQQVLVLARKYFDEAGVLLPRAETHFETFTHKVGKTGHELRCYDDALAQIARLRDQAARQEAITRAFPRGLDDPAWEGLLKFPLYQYQREGAWFAARAGRCLIADEMGLGKTIQAVAAVEILARTTSLERVLIVCPTSLKHQWQQEIEKFCDRSAQVIGGFQAARQRGYAQDSFYKIVNYDVIARDLAAIAAWGPDLIVLDEAQRIKNWKTRTAQTVKRLKSELAIVLTGTPLENRLEELHSILEFVDRFRLGPAFRFLAEHQHTNEHGRVIGYRNLTQIGETLKPVLIRRAKSEVAQQLPERLDKHFFLPMTPQQWTHHEENKEIVGKLVAKWKRHGFLSDTDQRRLLTALQLMRMSCNSTYLIDQATDHGYKADEFMALLEEVLEQPEAKVVVFSQWLRTHELLMNRLKTRQRDYVLFHGGVPSSRRGDLVKRFKQDPACRLFLSTDAGGVGLNLQHASNVIIMDQPWNPAVLEQRIGRVHRLGQHRPVNVTHFISEGTIEHGMLAVLAFKKSLFTGVLDRGEDEIFLGGTKMKRFMESIEQVTGAIPAPPPQEEVTDDLKAPQAVAGADEQAPGAVPPGEQLWAELVEVGQSLLGKLQQALQSSPRVPGQTGVEQFVSTLVERDEGAGQPCLKIPMPNTDTLVKVAELLTSLANGLRTK